jgi:hypothetical protein
LKVLLPSAAQKEKQTPEKAKWGKKEDVFSG